MHQDALRLLIVLDQICVVEQQLQNYLVMEESVMVPHDKYVSLTHQQSTRILLSIPIILYASKAQIQIQVDKIKLKMLNR